MNVINVKTYGANPDAKTDNLQAFLHAWSAACEYDGDSTLFIPRGTFMVSTIAFRGPCKRATYIDIRGTLKAPVVVPTFQNQYWMKFSDLDNFSITGANEGILDGQGYKSWRSHGGCRSTGKCPEYPHTLKFTKVSRGKIGKITLLDSKSVHMSFYRSNHIQVESINIKSPEDSPNTDGVHISGSSYINITSAAIGVGDDCVSIGPGTRNIFISDVTCGPGHGISVGSLGKYANEENVSDVKVKKCTMNGTSNGVRIKSWPGTKVNKAYNLTFEDIIMVNTSYPVIIDQEYCPGYKCDAIPSRVQITDITFKEIRGTSRTKSAVTFRCSSLFPCRNIKLSDINLSYMNGEATSTCSNVQGVAFGLQKPKPCF